MNYPLIYLRKHYETYPDDERNIKRDDNLLIIPDIGYKITGPLENPEIRKTCFQRRNLFTYFKQMFDYYPAPEEVLPGIRIPSPYKQGYTLELTRIDKEESLRIFRWVLDEPTFKERSIYFIRCFLRVKDPYFFSQYLLYFNSEAEEVQR